MDYIVRAMTKDGFVKAAAIRSTGIVERAREIHKTTPTATAALGRVLTAASLMGNMQKVENGALTLQIKGRIPGSRCWKNTPASLMWALRSARTGCSPSSAICR